jgi:hypothetical protein
MIEELERKAFILLGMAMFRDVDIVKEAIELD